MNPSFSTLADHIKTWGQELGFQQVGITDVEPGEHATHLERWLDQGFHGEMGYMAQHGTKRSQPDALIPGTLRVISARMDHLPQDTQPIEVLENASLAYVARYTMGRDYHKVLRARLKKLWQRTETWLTEHDAGTFHGRVFTDSAPVLEKAFAEKAGLGWIGKNTLLLNRTAGSWFFLGEIFTDLPLPVDLPQPAGHCGTCSACIDVCPTDAIVAPYKLDARRCISYLTIEHRGSIDPELRPKMGNRIFGCDDCQLFCPWNKFAKPTAEADFQPRHNLDSSGLLELFRWSEAEFLNRTEGSAIRRTGYQGWQRNIAVALGNGAYQEEVVTELEKQRLQATELVREHIDWALLQLKGRRPEN